MTSSIRGWSPSCLTDLPDGRWLEERKLTSQASSISWIFCSKKFIPRGKVTLNWFRAMELISYLPGTWLILIRMLMSRLVITYTFRWYVLQSGMEPSTSHSTDQKLSKIWLISSYLFSMRYSVTYAFVEAIYANSYIYCKLNNFENHRTGQSCFGLWALISRTQVNDTIIHCPHVRFQSARKAFCITAKIFDFVPVVT